MTNNDSMPTPDFSKMTRLERQMYFSSAKGEIVPLGRPAKKITPRRNRRTSVRHRAIR